MKTEIRAWRPSVGKCSALVLLAGSMIFASLAEAAKPVGGGGGGGGGTKLPAISVTPSSVSFGEQRLGTTSAARSVTISNTGRANLQFSSIRKAGAQPESFPHTTTCATTLAPAASCTVSLRFSPATVGTLTASLDITSNASNGQLVTVPLTGIGVQALASVRRVEGAGDSIMQGYNATCSSNTGLFDFLCYGGGDQPANSFLDGSSTVVTSLVDRYKLLDSQVTGGKAASASGSEMTAGDKNNFATQASAIVSAATQSTRVFVELGGNDLCNRATVNDLYPDTVWETAVKTGLEMLVTGLPAGSTVMLVSVPRVQDLRAAGIAKQTASGGSVNCQNFWASYDVCRIATADGGDLTTRLAAVGARQRAYNDKLVVLASEFNARATTTGVEVVAEFDPTANASVGSYSFQASDINGGDCFHPSIQGQNKLSEIIWGRNPYK